jgi:FeS assembly SUF system regulator
MLRITKLSDYAVVVLQRLSDAADPNGATARAVARLTRIPQPTVQKVMKDLARAGVLASQRGAQGGYSLARSADRISLAEIIEAVEGPIALTECSAASDACSFAGACPAEENWLKINQVVRRALDGITLADLARPLTPPLLDLGGKRPRAATEIGSEP